MIKNNEFTEKKNKKRVVKPKDSSPKELKKTKKPKKYTFKHFYESETQLRHITHMSDPEEILKAYNRLIWVHAANHIREGVELEDLLSEGQRGICEAIKEFNDPTRKKPNYNFHQACLYKIRSSIFQYCLRNASLIKTPYYIQRGCMHLGQIFKLMSSQPVAEALLNKKGPATEQDIIDFIYNEKERLPLKPLKFIKAQITKDPKYKAEFKQILNGILHHETGSRHSYVKNNLTDVGKVLHIKEKLFYSSNSNNMNYKRVIELILSARQSKIELNINTYSPQYNDLEATIGNKQLIDYGEKVCGKLEFTIFINNKVLDKSYDELAKEYSLKKLEILTIIRECTDKLRKDKVFQDIFNGLN